MLEDGKYVYTYAPTYFSSLANKLNLIESPSLVKGIGHLIGKDEYQYEIYENELKIIENDYRTELLNRLKKIKQVHVLDYSKLAKGVDWFLDYSHYNEYAASELAKLLAKELISEITSD